MDENLDAAMAEINLPLSDKLIVVGAGTVVGLVAKHFAEKGAKLALAAYRARKAAA